MAVGGGSVIDCCKIIALQARTDEDVWETELEKGRLPACKPIPLGAIVTVSGTGSEMNGGGVITNEEKKIKTELFGAAPRFAVIHPAYYRHIVKEGLPKFVRFATNVWGIPRGQYDDMHLALAGIDALAGFIKECGLPTRLSELKVRTPITDKLLEEVAYSTTIQPNSYKKMTGGEIYEILKECM